MSGYLIIEEDLLSNRQLTIISIPTWLTKADKVFTKKHLRHNMYERFDDTVEIIQTNPHYLLVLWAD